MSTVQYGLEVRISAPTDAVWSVLSTPSQQPVLEPRVRLVSEWGEPGALGSGYEVTMRGRPIMRATVTDAVPGERLVVTIEWNGRIRGAQEARLRSDGGVCALTYIVSSDVPLGLRSIQRAVGRKQLSHWLDAVDRLSTASGEPQR